MSRLAQFGRNMLILLMLLSAIGPLAVLQMVAWGGMLWNYSKDRGVVEAVEATFNGKNPCALCTTIQQAEKSPDRDDTGIVNAQGSLLLPIKWEAVYVLRPCGESVPVHDLVLREATWVMEVAPPPPKQESSLGLFA